MTSGILGIMACPILEDELIYSLRNDGEEKSIFLLDNDHNKMIVPKLEENGISYTVLDERRFLSGEANIPDDGKRYALVTPDVIGLILKADEFIDASDLGDEVKKTGAIGKIAGFLIIEFNDDTENLGIIAGHPRFATRANEFSVPVKIQDLSGSGKYIGASAVQGRNVYAHKVLRSVAIKAVYTDGLVTATAAVGTATAGDTKITATVGTVGNTLAYKKNPAKPAYYGVDKTLYDGTAMTSGTAKVISSCSVGDEIEVLEFDANSVCVSKTTVALTSDVIKSA